MSTYFSDSTMRHVISDCWNDPCYLILSQWNNSISSRVDITRLPLAWAGLNLRSPSQWSRGIALPPGHFPRTIRIIDSTSETFDVILEHETEEQSYIDFEPIVEVVEDDISLVSTESVDESIESESSPEQPVFEDDEDTSKDVVDIDPAGLFNEILSIIIRNLKTQTLGRKFKSDRPASSSLSNRNTGPKSSGRSAERQVEIDRDQSTSEFFDYGQNDHRTDDPTYPNPGRDIDRKHNIRFMTYLTRFRDRSWNKQQSLAQSAYFFS